MSGRGHIQFNSTLAETAVTGLNAKGTYKFNWVVRKVDAQDNLLCEDFATVIIDNMSYTLDADEKYSTNQVNICTDNYELAGQSINGGVGEWEVIGGTGYVDDSDKNNPKAIVKGIDGSVTLTWTVNVAGGCSNSDEVTILMTVLLLRYPTYLATLQQNLFGLLPSTR